MRTKKSFCIASRTAPSSYLVFQIRSCPFPLFTVPFRWEVRTAFGHNNHMGTLSHPSQRRHSRPATLVLPSTALAAHVISNGILNGVVGRAKPGSGLESQIQRFWTGQLWLIDDSQMRGESSSDTLEGAPREWAGRRTINRTHSQTERPAGLRSNRATAGRQVGMQAGCQICKALLKRPSSQIPLMPPTSLQFLPDGHTQRVTAFREEWLPFPMDEGAWQATVHGVPKSQNTA